MIYRPFYNGSLFIHPVEQSGGHTLAYEALNRIYWNYFVKWVGTQEHLKTPEMRIKIGEIVQEFSKSDIDSKVEKRNIKQGNRTKILDYSSLLLDFGQF